MTNREYLLAQIGFAPAHNTLDAALSDNLMDPAGTYSLANSIPIKTAAISVIKIILTTPDTAQGTGETRSEQKYDRPSLLKLLDRLEDEVGLSAGRPTIRGLQVW